MTTNDLEPFRIFLNVTINYGWYGPVTVCYGLLRIGMKPNVFKTYFHNYFFEWSWKLKLFKFQTWPEMILERDKDCKLAWWHIDLIFISSPKLSPFYVINEYYLGFKQFLDSVSTGMLNRIDFNRLKLCDRNMIGTVTTTLDLYMTRL